jgi:hypothetical protein
MVLRGAGGVGAVYGLSPMAGSEITSLGGGALRPRATANGGTPGELAPPNNGGVTVALPIAKISRKQRDLITAGVFMRREFLGFHLEVKGKRRRLDRRIAFVGDSTENVSSAPARAGPTMSRTPTKWS